MGIQEAVDEDVQEHIAVVESGSFGGRGPETHPESRRNVDGVAAHTENQSNTDCKG